MQTSLIVNTSYPSTTHSLSLHQHLKFVRLLSSTQRHPVIPLGRHVCHVTTFGVHFAYGDLTHSPSRSTMFSISASVPKSYPPFIIGTMPTVRSTRVMRMPRHHHSRTHIRVRHSRPRSLAVARRRSSQDSQHFMGSRSTHTSHSLSHFFAHPFWCPRAGLRTSVRTHRAWARAQPDTDFLATFHSPVLNLSQTSLLAPGST